MTDQEILDTLRSIVNEIAGVAEADITLEKSFVDDLDVDSLSMVSVGIGEHHDHSCCYRRWRNDATWRHRF